MKNFYNKNWENFQSAKSRNGLAHAFLFSGSEGLGKKDFVLELAANLNKLQDLSPDDLEFGKCPDVIFIAPGIEEKNEKRRIKNISAEEIRKALDRIKYHNFSAPYKIMIINRADRMSLEAANSLLKTLEEPPKTTLFFLIAENDDAVLPTIKSRCQRIRFHFSSKEKIEEYLKATFSDFSNEEISQAAEGSWGRVRLAGELLLDKIKREEAKRQVDLFRKAIRGGAKEFIELAEKVSSDKDEAIAAIDHWLWYLREFTRNNVRESANIKVIEKLQKMTSSLLLLRKTIVRTNANVRLQVENYFIQLS